MPSEPQIVVVPRSVPGERLDVFLRNEFPTISRGTIQRLIENGDILLNGRTAKPTHHPRVGEQIQIRWPDARPCLAQAEEMAFPVIMEDEDLLVLNKPVGLVVHPAAGHEEHTLVNALLHHCGGQLSGIGGVARPGIVHRLDKDTSGCLVVAKNDFSHVALAAQFARRDVLKLYQALLCGQLSKSRGEIKAAIARHPSHRKRMAVLDGGGREAWTSYRVLQWLNSATHVEAQLHTGRTHQIRVHFHHLGFPLVGDHVYGKRQNLRLGELTGYHAPRQMLHASTLSFLHPRTGQEVRCEAPLPQDFAAAVLALQVAGPH